MTFFEFNPLINLVTKGLNSPQSLSMNINISDFHYNVNVLRLYNYLQCTCDCHVTRPSLQVRVAGAVQSQGDPVEYDLGPLSDWVAVDGIAPESE